MSIITLTFFYLTPINHKCVNNNIAERKFIVVERPVPRLCVSKLLQRKDLGRLRTATVAADVVVEMKY